MNDNLEIEFFILSGSIVIFLIIVRCVISRENEQVRSPEETHLEKQLMI